MFAANPREIVGERKVVASLIGGRKAAEIAVRRNRENGESVRREVRNAKLLHPLLVVGGRGLSEVEAVITDAQLVEARRSEYVRVGDDRVEIASGGGLTVGVDQLPVDLLLEGCPALVPDRFPLVRVTDENLVLRGEL